jgi:hypothetical protein
MVSEHKVPWTMMGLPSSCTRVWTIMPHVKGRVKSPTLPRFLWVVDFISQGVPLSFKASFESE